MGGKVTTKLPCSKHFTICFLNKKQKCDRDTIKLLRNKMFATVFR